MLVEIEQSLVSYLKNSPLAERLRQIDALPDLDGDSLVGKFGADAPAVYVAVGSGEVLTSGLAIPTIGIACVARNSRSAQAGRHGDGQRIGLLELVDSVMILIDRVLIDQRQFEVLRWEMASSETLYRKGLYAAVVTVRTAAALDAEFMGGPR